MNNKPGMINIDGNRPIIETDGLPQQRLLILMHHPDYSLDAAFGGKGKPRPHRNKELDAMPLIDLLIDARKRAIEEIEKGTSWATNYAYSGLMCFCWKRAIDEGLINDPTFDRANYVNAGTSYPGRVCLILERAASGTAHE